MTLSHIPLRTHRILNFFFVSLLLILIRVWYLSVVKYETYSEEARKPQRRTLIEKAERGTIRDRFNLPLAINALQYNAAICYSDIRQIPTSTWEKDDRGKAVRVLTRKRYVENLSIFLADALGMDSQEIQDTILGKACLFPYTPCVLKEDVSEELFYRLKVQEKDWLGLQMQQVTKRIYPQGKVGCDIIGYLGAIGQREYLEIAEEIKVLKNYLTEHEEGKAVYLPKGFSNPEEVKARLHELEVKAYTINDQIGKSGIEASFDQQLRGSIGKKIYEIDVKGNVLQELPGEKVPIAGDRLILTLSSELQLEAEKLLTQSEFFQDARDTITRKDRRHPWQRGGAIVVMHPKTGEILACASYPRFDPNDLIPAQSMEKRRGKRSNIIKWLENEAYVGEIWDGKRPLQRERFSEGKFSTEELFLTWEIFLDTILSKGSSIWKNMEKVKNLTQAVHLDPSLLDAITNDRDRLLFLDLIHMIVKEGALTDSLLDWVGEQTLSDFRLFCQTAARHLSSLKELSRGCFHHSEFKKWREDHFISFLKEKRNEEKIKHRYTRPYTEYLEREEEKMFSKFWEKNRSPILYNFILEKKECPYSQEILNLRKSTTDPMLEQLKTFLNPLPKKERLSYIEALRTFEDLNRPLQGKYPLIRSKDGIYLEKHLAASFYPYNGFGFGRTFAFRQATPMGSTFKLVPSYAGLKTQYDRGCTDLNPLTLTDDMQPTTKPGSNRQILGFLENGQPIKRFYKGGRLPRAYPKIGKIDLVKAIERSSNIYFSILAGDVLDHPSILLNTALGFGLGSKTGIDLPGEYKGVLPNDILHDKTGLYSFAIGQHSLVVTPLQAAKMLCAIANGGELLKPQIVKFTVGKETGFVSKAEPEIVNKLFFSPEMRTYLLNAMHQTVNGERGSARLALTPSSFYPPEVYKAYQKLHTQMVGKTGTAEILYKQTIDAETPAQMEKHVWFGAISFPDEKLEDPELVVVVFSRFGSVGRQGAPLAARLIEKWREIQAKH